MVTGQRTRRMRLQLMFSTGLEFRSRAPLILVSRQNGRRMERGASSMCGQVVRRRSRHWRMCRLRARGDWPAHSEHTIVVGNIRRCILKKGFMCRWGRGLCWRMGRLRVVFRQRVKIWVACFVSRSRFGPSLRTRASPPSPLSNYALLRNAP